MCVSRSNKCHVQCMGAKTGIAAMSEHRAEGVWKRCEVARGLRCVLSNGAAEDGALNAPPFAVSFHLSEPMSIPILAQRALWALNYVQCCLKKGEQGALISKIPGLQCDLQHNIVSAESEADGTPLCTLSLMRMQLRIFSVRGAPASSTDSSAASPREEEGPAEHYMMLVVDSPAAFSLRKAIQVTSGSANRKTLADVNYTDKRRAVWSDLAIHASQYVHAPGGIEDRVGFYGACMDWLHAPDGRGFTALFNVHAAMDWAKMHFLRRHRHHGGIEEVRITGIEDALSNGRGDNFLTAPHLAACRRYHLAVDAGVAETYQELKKSPNKKRTREEEEAGARELPLPPPLLSDARLPVCEMALDVILPVPIEGPPPFDDFRTRVKIFPRAVSMRLLKAGMRMSNDFSMGGEDDEEVDDATVKEIMLHAPLDTRSMLCGRDAVLGEHMRALLQLVGEDQRLEHFKQGLRLTLAIVRTRATGSDNFTQERVAAFNEHFMRGGASSAATDASIEACGRVHHEMCHVFAGGGAQLQRRRLGNCDDEAQRFVARCLSSCNVELKLKPDNLYLLMQLLCTDLMLGLDYHRSALEAAPNGIGATLIVCDGGGNYRYEAGGLLVYSKTNGTGADHVMNAFMKLTEVPRYLRGCSYKCNYFEELKHATELSIVQTVCNSYIGTGEDATVERTITEAMKRTYATEFVANNSQAALNCMKALSWLVERNTTMSGDSGVYKTTSETDDKKGRHTFIYRPAIGGLVLLCTNAVHPNCYERFHTVAQVSRKLTSSAHLCAGTAKEDEVNETTLLRVGRPLFSDVMCTIVNAGFAQWTGALGRIPEAAVGRALAAAIHHQLDRSFHLFNPDMTGSDKKRFRQVSRSRSVPIALMTLAARETSEVGRQGGDHCAAVERTCQALMTEGTQCAAWWLCAELLEHTLRWDFFCLMQMLAKAFRVPADLTLDEVLDWIGEPAGGGGRLHQLCASSDFIQASLFEREGGNLPHVEQCMYLRHAELDVGGLSGLPDATVEDYRGFFCRKAGAVLQGWSKRELSDGCRVKDSETGRQIVGHMLLKCINEQFSWPSMFQPAPELANFWKGRHPAATDRSLAPLRMIHVGNGRATLGVDMRWLLVCAAMGGVVPAQTMRFMIVRHLARRIVQTCLPRRMLTAPRVFIGMPHACMERGMEPLEISARLLRRRLLLRHTRTMGMDAPVVPSGMVEDLGPAGPRLQLTQLLYGGEGAMRDCLPTDSAHAPLPHDLWTPVQLEASLQHPDDADGATVGKGSFAGLKCNSEDGTFWVSLRHPHTGRFLPPMNVTGGDYLYGRVTVAVRPLCVFDRPGVLVWLRGAPAVLVTTATALARRMEATEAPLMDALDSLDEDANGGALFYVALRWHEEQMQLIEATPDAVWDGIVAPDAALVVDAAGLVEDGAEFSFYSDDGGRLLAPQAGSLLQCRLDSQGAPEDLAEDCIFVRARKAGGGGFDDGGGILSSDTREIDEHTIGFAVHIRRVVALDNGAHDAPGVPLLSMLEERAAVEPQRH